MKGLAILAIFAAGFGLGVLFENHRLEDRCNEIVEKEFESFRRFRKEVEAKKKEAKEEAAEDDAEETVDEEPTDEVTQESEAEKNVVSEIISKSEYGMLNYDVRTLEIFEDAERVWVEDLWGKEMTPSEAEDLLGVPLEELFDDDDQTSAYLRNDKDGIYYEIVREV